MNFQEALNIITEVLRNIGCQPRASYDGIAVKKLESSNTLEPDRRTNQTHIAITGQQMDIFPYLCSEGYFSTDYASRDEGMKKYYLTQIPVIINKNNAGYLGYNEDTINSVFERENRRVLTSIVRSRRNNQTDQLQMSLINFDSPEFIEFRRTLITGSYLVILKVKGQFKYEFYGVKGADASFNGVDLQVLNNQFIKDSSSITTVDIEEMTSNSTSEDFDLNDILDHNLYGIHIKEKNDAISDENPHVCIGWSSLGDLVDVDSKEALGLRYDEHIQKEPRGRGQDIGQIWRFINDVQIGDYIIFADEGVCHIGRIESDYYFDDTENPNEDPDYANKRKVTWLKKNIARSSLSTAFHRSLMTAMSIWGLNDYKSSVVELLKGTYKKDIIDDLGEVKEKEGVRKITFESNIDCDLPRNRILFGAPGTGKSHTLDKETDALIKSMDGEYERVTFHPDYSYANFVGTYKPVPSADGITYKYVPGPFMRVLKKALENANNLDATPRPFVLVIEEINRANVAAVFGDVFQLLDRNGKNISDYSIQASEDLKNHLAEVLGGNPESYAELRIPSNMFIWATMNSADQGVFPMDTAFKRRWDFTYLGIDNGDENIAGKSVTLGKGDYKRVVEWNKLRKAINAVLSSKEFKINEDKLMGPYFLSTKVIPLEGEIDAQKFTDSFKSKVIMYLFEDAAKQKKHTLFSGCSDTTRYSSIRDEFDTKGVFIFCEEIHNQFPAPANGEGETE